MHYGYDGLNRLTAIQYPTDTVQFAYDAAGNRTAMTDSLGVTTYVYDDLYRVISVTAPFTGTVGYGYDLAGNRTRLIYPTGQVVTYTHDADNRLVGVADWDGGQTAYGYDGAGRLVTITLPNGAVTANEYDNAGRLVHLTHTASDDTLLADYGYELDGVGNRVGTVETLSGTTRVITYTYDPLNRLTGADYSTGEQFGYAYDEMGNRTVMTDATGVTTYTYDAANRLTKVGDVVYSWDARGNLTNDGTFTYTYNAAGRMVRAYSLTSTLLYTYTADGLRVAQSVDGDVTTFAWDWATGVPEMLSDGQAMGSSIALYLVGHETLGSGDGAVWTFYLPDALGSIRQETDGTGAVPDSREWTPFGVEVGTAQEGLGYVGQWQTGYVDLDLLYLRSRWYAVEVGRFTTPDTVVPDFYQPQSTNLYLYALANPVRWVDPSGHSVDWMQPPLPPWEPLPLPPSYVRIEFLKKDGSSGHPCGGPRLCFEMGASPWSGQAAGVAIDENAILTHNHLEPLQRVECVKVLDALDKVIHIAHVHSVAMAGDAELGGGLSLLVFKGNFIAWQDTVLLGDADELREGIEFDRP